MVNIIVSREKLLKKLSYYPEDSYTGQDGAVFTQFLRDVRKAYPHLTFYRVSSSGAWIMVNKDDLFGVAQISYGDVRIKSSSSKNRNTFNLYSRTIVNPNIRDDRDEHHMKRTSTADKLIPLIGTYVKALSVPELIDATLPDVSGALYAFYNPLITKRSAYRRTAGLVPDSPVERYILGVGRARAGLLPPDLQPVLDYIAISDEVASMDVRSREVRAVVIGSDSVRVAVVPTRYRYDGVPELAMVRDPAACAYEIYGYNEVPQIIKDRVNVLNITERLEFIPNVGVKYSDKVFYVVI